MKYSALMIVTAAFAFFWGILFVFSGALLIPHFSEDELPLHSAPSHPKSIALSFGHMFGAALILTGIIAWTTKNLERAEDQRNVTRAFFAGVRTTILVA